MTKRLFLSAILIAGIASMNATAKTRLMKPPMASIICMNLATANATVTTADNRTVHYTVNAGGDPSLIELEFIGADRVYLDLSGRLVMSMRNGDLRTYNATFYQLVDGKRKLISGNFRTVGANHAAFQVGKYNTALPLEIDAIINGRGDFRG